MRENRPYGLEGGGAQTNVSSLPLSTIAQGFILVALYKSQAPSAERLAIQALSRTLEKVPTQAGVERLHPLGFMRAGTLSITRISAMVCDLGLLLLSSVFSFLVPLLCQPVV